jgi:nickel/cobalt transporter (NicO) family protein
MTKPIVVALCVIFFIGTSAQGQVNPFLSSTQENQNPEEKIDGVKSQVKPLLPGVQRDLNSRLSALMQRLEEEGSAHLWFLILGVAFLYGIIHALGPGHRKTVIFSYFLSEDATVRQGIISGFLLAILHAGASVAIVSLLYFVFKTTLMTTFENINLIIQRISAGLLLLIGIIMLSLKVRTLFRSGKRKEDSQNLSRPYDSRRSLIPVIVVSGIIPCPGAAMILILALTMGSFTIGVIAVASMSLGMAVTVSGVAVVTIVGKERILHFVERKATLRKWLHEGVETVGALILVLFAVLFFFLS